MLSIVESVKFIQYSDSRVDALLVWRIVIISPFVSQLIRAVELVISIFATKNQKILKKLVNWLKARNDEIVEKYLDFCFKAAKQINLIKIDAIEFKLNMQLELMRSHKNLKETVVGKCLLHIALIDMGITQTAGDTSTRGIKPLPPFSPKNVIIAFISSIFEEEQAEVWEVNCHEIVPEACIRELFLEKTRYFLRVKYFNQVHIHRTEYMNTNPGSQEILTISDSVDKKYFLLRISQSWRAKFAIS